MILPKGITGFLGKDTAPPQILDEKAFRQMCYSIAKENGGTVFDHIVSWSAMGMATV